MLVCIFFCALRTRDRGCGAHPVFPAPSLVKRVKLKQTSDASRRENADAYPSGVGGQVGCFELPHGWPVSLKGQTLEVSRLAGHFPSARKCRLAIGLR